MRFSRITLQNFRCFGPDPTTIEMDELTALIGANGCGKSAALQALARLFGVTTADRTIQADDFHLPKGTRRDELEPGTELELVIEAWIEFPELDDEAEDHAAIPPVFKQMTVESPEASPFCRVRLEASWKKSNLPDGDVEQHIFWVTSGDPDPDKRTLKPMSRDDRSYIHVHYVPATRDPVRQIRYVSGTILTRLFDAAEWSPAVREEVETASATVQEAFGNEPGVKGIEQSINAYWQRLHAAHSYKGVKLRPLGQRLEELFKQVEAVFTPAPGGNDEDLDRLSDGLRSLFYLALVGAAFQIEAGVARGEEGLAEHFSAERLNAPALTVFAVEEPENHVAPHLLGRILHVFRSLIDTERAQVVLTSHSPSILRRIEPTEVQHLRLDVNSGTTLAHGLVLPEDDGEAFKYVREAVRAFPELYFARLVVLGEGDTEELVIPRIAEAKSIPIDLSLVSVVPLGGRHVNHFWRLLSDLGIPHVTLLDLDQERAGGGWGRVHYALTQLLNVGVDRNKLLAYQNESGNDFVLSEAELEELKDYDRTDTKNLRVWMRCLEEYNVFFSSPLDLDYMMLQAFQDAYKLIPEGAEGPSLPNHADEKKNDAAVRSVVRSVLKGDGGDGSTYKDSDRTNGFFWYRYLFLGRGKPTSHLAALATLSDKELAEHTPKVLARLCERIGTLLALPDEDDSNAG